MLDTLVGFVRDCFSATILRDTIVRLEHRLAETQETVQRLEREKKALEEEIQRLQAELGECRLGQAQTDKEKAALQNEIAARQAPAFCDWPAPRHDLSGW